MAHDRTDLITAADRYLPRGVPGALLRITFVMCVVSVGRVGDLFIDNAWSLLIAAGVGIAIAMGVRRLFLRNPDTFVPLAAIGLGLAAAAVNIARLQGAEPKVAFAMAIALTVAVGIPLAFALWGVRRLVHR